jgi:GNAT superfamily N-acetyltransferase
MAGTGGARMTTVFRDGNERDAEALDRIFDKSFCDTFAHLYEPADLNAFLASHGIEDWRAELVDPRFAFRVAEVDGEPVGYVKLGPMEIPFETRRPAIMLQQFYLLREFQGVGIAQELMAWAFDEARRRDVEEMYLTVFIENHRARRFYDRFGFEAAGRYDFMVGNHADEDVIMRKTLLEHRAT